VSTQRAGIKIAVFLPPAFRSWSRKDGTNWWFPWLESVPFTLWNCWLEDKRVL